MDQLDRKLLAELERGGYQASGVLARSVGVPQRTVRRRLNLMQAKGVLKVTAVENPVLMGYKGWAKIGVKVAPGFLWDVSRELVEHHSVYFVAHCIGRFNIMVAVQFKTVEELTYFVSKDIAEVKGVLATETIMLMCPRKYYHFSWPEPDYDNNGVKHATSTPYNVYELDTTDWAIIQALVGNGKLSAKDLKERLNLSEGTIRARLNKMREASVYRLEAVPNPDTRECEAWATMGVVIGNKRAHKVINMILENPAVYMASVSLGRFNVLISARFEDIRQVNEFVNFDLGKIKGITSVETFLHTRVLKYHNVKWQGDGKHNSETES